MKYISFILTTILFASSIVAQTKKPVIKKAPPVIEDVYMPPPAPAGHTDSDYPSTQSMTIMIPESDLTSISAENVKGENVSFKNVTALELADLSQITQLTISTRRSDQTLDVKVLEKVLNEAKLLEKLDIRSFKMTAFPEITSQNRTLKILRLEYNDLKILPQSISNLVALEQFSLSNPLQELPETFSELQNMKILSLNNVEFKEFPKSLFSLSKLSILYISGKYQRKNSITELPDMFDKLPNLTEFGVSSSSLSKLPTSIATLHKLTNVSFSNNNFIDFPEVLTTNPKLVFVDFNANPFQWTPFLVSIKKIKWRGLFFLHEVDFTKKQFEETQKVLSKIDVYYDGMND